MVANATQVRNEYVETGVDGVVRNGIGDPDERIVYVELGPERDGNLFRLFFVGVLSALVGYWVGVLV